MTPTLKLDRVYRPITVPDHFIGYRSVLSADRLKCTVSFLRLKLSDGEPTSFLRAENAKTPQTPYSATHAQLSFAQTMTCAPESAARTYEVEYTRKSDRDMWIRQDDPRLTDLIRMFADRFLSDSERA